MKHTPKNLEKIMNEIRDNFPSSEDGECFFELAEDLISTRIDYSFEVVDGVGRCGITAYSGDILDESQVEPVLLSDLVLLRAREDASSCDDVDSGLLPADYYYQRAIDAIENELGIIKREMRLLKNIHPHDLSVKPKATSLKLSMPGDNAQQYIDMMRNGNLEPLSVKINGLGFELDVNMDLVAVGSALDAFGSVIELTLLSISSKLLGSDEWITNP